MAARTDPIHLLTPELRDAILRNDFASFVRLTFETLKPNEKLIWGRYLEHICAALGDVVLGDTRRLIINIPPRFLKSICGSVALPAFFLGHFPSAEVMCVSYAAEIARGFAEDTRKVMQSDAYFNLFGTRLTAPRAAVHMLKTTAGGSRRATSIEGVATALGANLLIFDDPQKAGETLSDAMRQATNRAYETTFLSRQNDPQNQRIVIIMQRLHEDDFVGHVLGLGGEWKVINLPAIAEDDETWDYSTFLGDHVWRRPAGELLHPERFPLAVLKERREQSGEAIWASQYQQHPTAPGGGIVRSEWFRRVREIDLPRGFDRVIQSWDTANTIEQWSDYSVCTTWGAVDDRLYLIDVFRKRLLYPDLKRAVLERARFFKATTVLIENRASGMQLLQEFSEGLLPIAQGVDPERDKKMRMASQTAMIENGLVYIAEDAPWAAEYLHELATFPKGKYDDQIDSTSQAIAWINNTRMACWGVYEFTRQEALRLSAPPVRADALWRMIPPPGSGGHVISDIHGPVKVEADGTMVMTANLAQILMRSDPEWRRADE